MNEITSLVDWGRFGLAGAVIGALFVQTGWFLRSLSKKDSENRDFIREIIADDRIDRREDRREHQATTNRLSDAIGELTKELRADKQDKA